MSRILAQPAPGYFKLRMVKGGPFVPARIYRQCCCTIHGGQDNAAHPWRDDCDRYPPLQAEINGEAVAVHKVWEWGTEISQAKFNHMMAIKDWAQTNAPFDPAANPRHPVDLNKQPTIF